MCARFVFDNFDDVVVVVVVVVVVLILRNELVLRMFLIRSGGSKYPSPSAHILICSLSRN